MKILTLEDELEINDFYEVLLKEFNYEVLSASTADEAISIARDHGVNLGIIDHTLSITNSSKTGLETISELKKIRPEMKIIMVSANYPEELEKNFKDHGIDLLIKKPFNIDEMIYHIGKLGGKK